MSRDKRACTKAYSRHLKKMAPTYKYHFRLWCSSDLYDLADSWEHRSTPLEDLVENKYPLYKRGEKHLRESPATRHSTKAEMDKNLNAVFTKYQSKSEDASEDPDVLFEEGLDAFFETCLKHPPTLLNRLILATVLESPDLGDIDRQNFVDAFRAYGLSSEASLATFFTTAVKNLTTTTLFAKDLYASAFFYANGARERKSISVKRAFQFWELLVPALFPAIQTYPDWKAWLQKVVQSTPEQFGRPTTWLIRGDPSTGDEDELRLDLWLNFYEFLDKVKDDFVTNYDFDGGDAWNTALDQFVFDFLDLEYVVEQDVA